MVVAIRELKETMPGGIVITHAPGAVLERFGKWDYAVQKALRRMGHVADQDKKTDPLEDSHGPSAKVEQSSGGGLRCPHCPDRAFVNPQGLKLHMTRIHG